MGFASLKSNSTPLLKKMHDLRSNSSEVTGKNVFIYLTPSINAIVVMLAILKTKNDHVSPRIRLGTAK